MRTWVLALLAVAVMGCARSVYPLYTDADLASDSTFLGTWVHEDTTASSTGYSTTLRAWVTTATLDTVIYVVTPDSASAYRLEVTDKSGTSTWSAHLVRFGGRTWLDLLPAELPPSLDESYRAHFLRVHSIYVLERSDSSLLLYTFHSDSIAAFVRRRVSAVQHLVLDDDVLLTAPPRDLQAFFRRYTRPGVLCPPTRLTRVVPPAAAPTWHAPLPDSAYADCEVGMPT